MFVHKIILFPFAIGMRRVSRVDTTSAMLLFAVCKIDVQRPPAFPVLSGYP